MIKEEIEEVFLNECKEDYVGLWVLVRAIRETEPGWSSTKIMHEVLLFLEKLLKDQKIIVGIPDELGGFEMWKFKDYENIEKIKSLWLNLGRDPDIGDVVWITSSVEN